MGVLFWKSRISSATMDRRGAGNAGHVSLGQLKVMSAIESCRTAALGGHVARCEECAHEVIAYNSCRNRHCPKCQGAAARRSLAEREAELLPIAYYHVVFTLPAAIGDIAYQNKAVIYDLLFKASADTMIAIAADPEHLGARIGVTSVLRTWGSALTAVRTSTWSSRAAAFLGRSKWAACRPGFFLPVRVLSRLFRRCFSKASRRTPPGFCNSLARMPNRGPRRLRAISDHVTPRWMDRYGERPSAARGRAGLSVALHHRVAISNSACLLRPRRRRFQMQDYRVKGRARRKVIHLAIDQFIRRFLIHVLQPLSPHAITACSPAARARKTSPARASCSLRRPRANRIFAPMTAMKPAAHALASVPMLQQPHDRRQHLNTDTLRAPLPTTKSGSTHHDRIASPSRRNATVPADGRSPAPVAFAGADPQTYREHRRHAKSHLDVSGNAPSLHAVHRDHLRSSLRPRLN